MSGPILVPYLSHADVDRDMALLNKGSHSSSAGGSSSKRKGSSSSKLPKPKGDVETFYDHVQDRLFFDGKWWVVIGAIDLCVFVWRGCEWATRGSLPLALSAITAATAALTTLWGCRG